MSISAVLTSYLLRLDPAAYTAATEQPFLVAAARDTLQTQPLLQWLLQDRHYAITYISFVSAILAKVNIPTTSDRTSTIYWDIVDTLIFSLTNIKTELETFDKVLKDDFGWSSDSEVEGSPITRVYKDLFAGSSAPKASLLEGLVVLWATERCYYDAWWYARNTIKSVGLGEGGVMTRVFIPNWTSKDFKGFVDKLESLVNGLVKEEDFDGGDPEWQRCIEVWRQVLWVEERFWPEV